MATFYHGRRDKCVTSWKKILKKFQLPKRRKIGMRKYVDKMLKKY